MSIFGEELNGIGSRGGLVALDSSNLPWRRRRRHEFNVDVGVGDVEENRKEVGRT